MACLHAWNLPRYQSRAARETTARISKIQPGNAYQPQKSTVGAPRNRLSNTTKTAAGRLNNRQTRTQQPTGRQQATCCLLR